MGATAVDRSQHSNADVTKIWAQHHILILAKKQDLLAFSFSSYNVYIFLHILDLLFFDTK